MVGWRGKLSGSYVVKDMFVERRGIVVKENAMHGRLRLKLDWCLWFWRGGGCLDDGLCVPSGQACNSTLRGGLTGRTRRVRCRAIVLAALYLALSARSCTRHGFSFNCGLLRIVSGSTGLSDERLTYFATIFSKASGMVDQRNTFCAQGQQTQRKVATQTRRTRDFSIDRGFGSGKFITSENSASTSFWPLAMARG